MYQETNRFKYCQKNKIKKTFNVSDYSVRKAQKLFKDKGILAEPNPRCGKKLSFEIM